MRCLAIIMAGLLLTAPATAQTTQVLLKADSTAASKKIDSLSKQFGAKLDRKVPGLNATILSVPTGELDNLITSAKSGPGISTIEILIGNDYRHLFRNVPSADRNAAVLSQAQNDAILKLRERASSDSLYLLELRPAGISIDLLKGALTTADGFPRPKGIKLNLAPGVSVDATQTRMDRQPGSGLFVWYGKIDSQKSGAANLVVNGNRISGTVAVGGDVYTVNPLGDGMHAIVKTNPGAYPPDHPPGALPERPPGVSLPSSSPPVPKRGGTLQHQVRPIIRALVLYTPAVRQAVTSPEEIAEWAVANTNSASRTSGVHMRLEVAKAIELNYSEKDFSSDLEMLRSSPDVAQLRDSAQAQVVFLLTTIKGACGLSAVIKAENKDSAFSVVNYVCAVGNFSLAHELGHLLGLRHDIWHEGCNTPYKNGHGYVYEYAWRTIMASKDDAMPRVPVWSNPAVDYDGVPSGTNDYENEASVINKWAPIVARFH